MKKFVVPMYDSPNSYEPGQLKSDARIVVAGVKWFAGFMVGSILRAVRRPEETRGA